MSLPSAEITGVYHTVVSISSREQQPVNEGIVVRIICQEECLCQIRDDGDGGGMFVSETG